jgi:hypothetical protein
MIQVSKIQGPQGIWFNDFSLNLWSKVSKIQGPQGIWFNDFSLNLWSKVKR